MSPVRCPKLFICLSIFVSTSLLAETQLPNIVLIVADDLGYADLSCYGSEDIQTPELDQLSEEGVRLTQFYANGPECSPTRVALLTGRYQQRVGGLECAIGLGTIGRYDEAKKLSDANQLGLPSRFSVLPKILNDKGYNTAIIGKWHLGEHEDFTPQAHGFDYSLGPLGGSLDYFHHTEPIGVFVGTYMEGERDFYRNGEAQDRDGYYLTHLITDEAINWLNMQNSDTPFFLYLPYTVPHTPLQAPDAYTDEHITVEKWRDGDRSVYEVMVEDFDRCVGEILNKLEAMGMADNTLVIFISDNGPTGKGDASPFRGYKGHVFEGGIRVPCIIRWPGNIDPATESDQMFMSMDLTASIASILNAHPERALDGVDLIDYVREKTDTHDRTLFWRKKRGSQIRSAARDGNWKYIYSELDNIAEEYLFDLKNDPTEADNLIETQSNKAEHMRQLLKDWETEVQPERYE